VASSAVTLLLLAIPRMLSVSVLLLLSPLSRSLYIFHHFFTLLISPPVFIIETNHRFRFDVIIEIVLWRTLDWLLASVHLVSPVRVSCAARGNLVGSIIVITFELLVIVKVIILIRPVIPIVKIIHALQLLFVNDSVVYKGGCVGPRPVSVSTVSASISMVARRRPLAPVLSGRPGGQLQGVHEPGHDGLELGGGPGLAALAGRRLGLVWLRRQNGKRVLALLEEAAILATGAPGGAAL